MQNPYQSSVTPSVHQAQTTTTITDIDIPFGRMVMIMLKMMLASIPAIIVMYAIMFVVVFGLAIVFGGLGALGGAFSKGSISL